MWLKTEQGKFEVGAYASWAVVERRKNKLQLWNWGNYELYRLIEKQDHRTVEGKLELCKLISSFALHVSGRTKFQSLIGFVYIVYNQ